MIGNSATHKTVYLNTQNATLRPDGEALRVLRPSKSDSLIPLRRIERAIVEHTQPDLLAGCLAIVGNGGTVHFTDAAGNLCGILQQPWADGTRWARSMARIIEHTHGNTPYRSWLKDQRRHAWSLVFRCGYRGDFEANRKRLVRYLLFFRPQMDATGELEWLEQQLWAWLQARLNRDGLQPIVRALEAKGEHLAGDLAPCLFIPLLWMFVRWRRHQATAVVSQRTQFFELQGRTRLSNQLQRHIHAMDTAYRGKREVDDTPLDALTRPSRLP